ncbi:MAG TPA: RdgB/HAM1 family non-canonical purine NTP pyrophosphatase [Gemmatimonadales bacterium]|nr:RdgB/HAM1 family non-canonical purine NTP pyrophosphatase [Gemmatimonadales bacterium]
MKILAATRNPGKQREIRRILGPAKIDLVFPEDIWLRELSDGDSLEAADSFEGNARRKAEYFVRLSSLPTFADDSGLEVFALGGAPGVRSKRFAGANGNDHEIDVANNAELLRRLAGAPESRRLARYRCVLVFLQSAGAVPTVCQGDCTGRILEAPRGNSGFGYDPLFLSDELKKTFGEATDEEKDSVSHRGRALRALVQSLSSLE